jgi:Putative Ig domain
MAALRPTVTGEELTYSVSPDLPAGLSLNTATGAISGKPAAATAKANYTVTAANVSGKATFSLELTVRPPPVIAVGTFRDATVSGLGYSSGEENGVTDSKGKFNYEVGESVTFAVGKVILGTAAQGKELITPVDIVPNGTGTSQQVLNIVRFLMMLDQDGVPDNGIEISEAVRTAADSWSAVDFATADLPNALAQIIAAAQSADGGSHVLPNAGEAQRHLNETFFCTHSGLYLGTTTWDAPTPGTSPFALVADADQSGVGYYRYDAAGGYVNFMGGGGPGYDESLDGSFASTLEHGPALSISLAGSWLDINHVNGSWGSQPAAIGGPEGGTFEVARIDAAKDPQYRFVGALRNATGVLQLDVNFTSPGAGEVTGMLYLLATDEKLSITGTIFGSDLTASAGNSIDLSGRYEDSGGRLRIDGNRGPYNFHTDGCRLN